jgi:hypothetical protein
MAPQSAPLPHRVEIERHLHSPLPLPGHVEAREGGTPPHEVRSGEKGATADVGRGSRATQQRSGRDDAIAKWGPTAAIARVVTAGEGRAQQQQ